MRVSITDWNLLANENPNEFPFFQTYTHIHVCVVINGTSCCSPSVSSVFLSLHLYGVLFMCVCFCCLLFYVNLCTPAHSHFSFCVFCVFVFTLFSRGAHFLPLHYNLHFRSLFCRFPFKIIRRYLDSSLFNCRDSF